MSHVVLLYPYTGSERPQDLILPLSLLYVAAPLVQEGYRITILDQRLEPGWREELRQAIQIPGTLAVGISSMTGPQIRYGLEMASVVREMSPSMPIIWGGVHPSLLPEQTAQSPLVDIVVVGEGENIFLSLIRAFHSNERWDALPGLCFMRNGEIVLTDPSSPPDLEKIPPLPYRLMDLNHYMVAPLRSGSTSLPIVTSRGCAFRCGYCYNIKFHSRKWRGQPAEGVMQQVRELVEASGIDGLFLLDDNFFGSRRRAEQILTALVESKLGLRIYNANCRVDFLRKSSHEFLQLVRRAGIEQVFVGVESGSNRVLRLINKDIEVAHVLEVNRKLRDVGVIPVYSFMAGMPDETQEDVKQTLALMVRLKQENPAAKMYKMSSYLPMPGTPLYEYCLLCRKTVFPQRLEEWSIYDYDHVNLSCQSGEQKRFLEKASEISGFLDVEGKVSGPLQILARAYSRLARFRCKTGRLGLMPEMAFIRLTRAIQRTKNKNELRRNVRGFTC